VDPENFFPNGRTVNFIMSGVDMTRAKRFSTCSLENINESLSRNMRSECLSGVRNQDGFFHLGDILVK
jgi:hypothetical protein